MKFRGAAHKKSNSNNNNNNNNNNNSSNTNMDSLDELQQQHLLGSDSLSGQNPHKADQVTDAELNALLQVRRLIRAHRTTLPFPFRTHSKRRWPWATWPIPRRAARPSPRPWRIRMWRQPWPRQQP